MKVLFVCGGSAGHVNPAIAIAEELRRKSPESEILFAGADKTLEKKLVPEAGFGLVNIKMSGLRRGFTFRDLTHNLKTARNLFTAGFKSAKLLKDYKPDAVIGTGGYISYPVIKKASGKGIRTYLLEPNAHPGLAVRMLGGRVDKVFVAYKELEDKYKHPDRVVYTGTPLRSEFLNIDGASNISVKRGADIQFSVVFLLTHPARPPAPLARPESPPPACLSLPESHGDGDSSPLHRRSACIC